LIPEAVERAKARLADNPAFVDELDRRGRERELVYKLAVLTGLRRGEIEALTVGHLHLNESLPFIRMRPQDTKNRDAVEIPLREDLADDLRQWLDLKRRAVAGVLSLRNQKSASVPSEPVFDVPRQLVKAFDRDLAAAGIPKVDERGRTVDVHALRHTFGTLLSKGGVMPRTAQQAMRHSKIDLTMNVYTDPRLLDVAGAVDLLPALPLSVSSVVSSLERQRATGTIDRQSLVAPTVAPAVVNSCNFESFSDNKSSERITDRKRKNPATTGVIAGFSFVETRGVEPLTPCLQSRCSPN
jgi:Phage integrase family